MKKLMIVKKKIEQERKETVVKRKFSKREKEEQH